MQRVVGGARGPNADGSVPVSLLFAMLMKLRAGSAPNLGSRSLQGTSLLNMVLALGIREHSMSVTTLPRPYVQGRSPLQGTVPSGKDPSNMLLSRVTDLPTLVGESKCSIQKHWALALTVFLAA